MIGAFAAQAAKAKYLTKFAKSFSKTVFSDVDKHVFWLLRLTIIWLNLFSISLSPVIYYKNCLLDIRNLFSIPYLQ